jgi:hypothetical protein
MQTTATLAPTRTSQAEMITDEAAEEITEERCWSRGDGLHEYSQCRHAMAHDDEHEDEEGHTWY